MIHLYERSLDLPATPEHRGLLEHLRSSVRRALLPGEVPVRFVIASMDETTYRCELGVLAGLTREQQASFPSIFDFTARPLAAGDGFNVVLLVPTGIGSTIGGHAGDANPVARLLAGVSDTLVTHPNVVNASDLMDLPDNGLYVEGSIVTRLMMGTVGLERARANRVLVVMDKHPDPRFIDETVNAVSAARAVYGLTVTETVILDPPVHLAGVWAGSGRATGEVDQLDGLLQVMDRYGGQYDAVALSTRVDLPPEYHAAYYAAHGDMVNPWGGAESLLTHAVSLLYGLPAAHSPMLESREIAQLALGQVDPRMAAEEISTSFFECVLKGLQRSPRIVQSPPPGADHGLLTVSEISCLVIPDKVLGLPTLAALEHGIPVIAVRENENILGNDLTALPWAPGQLHRVENYWEAVGVLAAMRAGIDPGSVRRPLADTHTVVHEAQVRTREPAPTSRPEAQAPGATAPDRA